MNGQPSQRHARETESVGGEETDRLVESYLDELGVQLRTLDPGAIRRYVDTLVAAWLDQRRVFIIGNGGSATTAAHHAVDLVKTAAIPGRKRLMAQALATEEGLLTAISNDIGYEEAFVFLLESYAHTGDVLVALSCSGSSPSTVRAARWARAHELRVVGLTGGGGELGSLSDIHIGVASGNYGIIEDTHLAVCHSAAQSLRRRLLELVALESALDG